jgi:hypothetical protein
MVWCSISWGPARVATARPAVTHRKAIFGHARQPRGAHRSGECQQSGYARETRSCAHSRSGAPHVRSVLQHLSLRWQLLAFGFVPNYAVPRPTRPRARCPSMITATLCAASPAVSPSCNPWRCSALGASITPCTPPDRDSLVSPGVNHESCQRAGAGSHAPAWEPERTHCVPVSLSGLGRFYDQGLNEAAANSLHLRSRGQLRLDASRGGGEVLCHLAVPNAVN